LVICRHHNYSLEDAFAYLLDRRPVAAPNYGFLLQLIRYEKEVRNKDRNPIEPAKDLPDQTSLF
jgi:hypothetical protein